jgi:hypothetical protein
VKIQIREENGLSTKPRCHSKLMSDALSEKEISGGVVHDLPEDLKKALTSDTKALETWEDITPLARNEWICWIESAKKAVRASKRENGDPVVGLAVRIVEIIAIDIHCTRFR